MVKIYMAPMEGVTTYVYRNVYAKYFGGMENTLICHPCVHSFQITDKSDFILLGCKLYFNLILFFI